VTVETDDSMSVTSTPTLTEFTTEVTCPRCGASADGRYCANCGTRLNRARDLSLKHFLHEALAAATDVDSALIGTFRTLIARPGKLSLEYLHGDRHRYLPPFRVFLLCNVVYFMFASRFGSTVLTAPLREQVGALPYRHVTLAALEHRYHLPPRAPNETLATEIKQLPRALVQRFDAATEELGKTILFVLVPVYALLFTLLFLKSGRYFVEHLVFATHFVSFSLLALPAIVLAFGGYTSLLTLAWGHPVHSTSLLLTGLALALGAYAYAAQRTSYESRPLPALARSAVVILTLEAAVVGVKFLLFFVTLAWIGR
jgi:hypothetical protein